MIFQNGIVFFEGKLKKLDVEISGERIIQVAPHIPVGKEETLDLTGKWLLPGFFDVHTHGRDGADFSDASPEELVRIRGSYARCGVTSLLATTMTMGKDYSRDMMKRIRKAIETPAPGAHIWGINMEGPFLGPDKKGCHDPQYLLSADYGFFKELDDCAGGHISLVDIDPRLEGAMDMITQVSRTKRVSVAHTSSDYETACQAVDAGADHVTHLFNAMNSLHHREPGVIGMVSDRDVWAELICDGVHIHPAVIRMMYRAVGEKLCIVSDSLSAAGLADGVYSLGGLDVHVCGNRATLADGTLACSVSNVFEECRNVISFGVSPELAIQSACANPALAIGLENEIGFIRRGNRADLLVTTPSMELEQVYINGKRFV